MNARLVDYIDAVGADRVFCPAHHLDDAGAPVELPIWSGSTVWFSDYEGWVESGPNGEVRHLRACGRRLP